MLPASAAPASQGGGRMMGGDDDDGDTIVETQEISSENLFHLGALVAHLPACATTRLDQRLCAIRSPSVQPAAPRHASRGRSGVLEPVASGAGAQLPARPSGAHTSIAIYRCEVADCGTRPTDSVQKKTQE